ncbi:hypothetical protein [Methylobacterium nodulans]|uniref:hypothetical protein n=1 Tax=Methylobacterium nodulans TaxID=114616 RepID=UPI0012EED91C|nr:hypothetical protein [Methylobacterium nodulans]
MRTLDGARPSKPPIGLVLGISPAIQLFAELEFRLPSAAAIAARRACGRLRPLGASGKPHDRAAGAKKFVEPVSSAVVNIVYTADSQGSHIT